MKYKQQIKNSLFVIGTFNLNANDSNQNLLISKMKELYELDNMLHTASTDYSCLMDWCLTNIDTHLEKDQ
jgi:hypothetical protein